LPTDPASTQVLLRRTQEGDKVALNDLCNRYMMRVLAAVRARLGAELRQKVESWDIVQDAMMASLKKVATFDPEREGAFLNWLAKVVENDIRDQIDFFRAGKRDHRREIPQGGPRSDDSSNPLDIPDKSGLPSPSQVLMLNEDLARLEKVMDQLPEDYRDLIVAVKIEGQTYQEIGDALGKSADAVRMQLNRAMAVLKELFLELDIEVEGS
jgi:RNA polymerase sigma-70 factor (ECF subfamily)